MAKAHQGSENWRELTFRTDKLGSWFSKGNKLLENKAGHLGCCTEQEVQLAPVMVCLGLMWVVCGKCNLVN